MPQYPKEQVLQMLQKLLNQTSNQADCDRLLLLFNQTKYQADCDRLLLLFNQSNMTPEVASITQNNLENNIDDGFSGAIPISVSIKTTLYILYALICLLGIIGNVMVCFVVIRNPIMHTVTNIFIFNLALSDILLCLFAVPFTPLYLLAYKQWVFGTLLCHLLPFAQGL